MLSKLKKPNREGFTIIEVMIVLAIAGLILLIVFLAVPALQRSSRNTSRKSDAGRISAAVNDFVSNNQGALPKIDTAAHWQTDCATIINGAGSLSQFSGITCTAATISATGVNGKFEATSGAISSDPFAAFTNGQDGLLLDEQAQCSGSNNSSAGTTRQAALFYTTETGGTPNTVCLNAE